jgi:hypothetical protein
MKTKSVLVAVLMGVSLMTFAGEPGNFKVAVVNQKESGIFNLIYEGEMKGKVKLHILDDAGTVVYQEIIKNVGNFVRPLNFTGMTYGEYTIEIADNTGTKSQRISYSALPPSTSYIRVTKTGEAGKYLFSVANAGTDEVNVKIYDGARELVHNQTMTVNGSLGLIYNLQRISGEPTFTVTDKAGVVKVIR